MNHKNRYGAVEIPIPEIRLLAALGYLPLLFFLPLLIRPRDRFCAFHGVQSLILLIIFVIFWIVVYILNFLLGKVLGNVIILGFVFKIAAWMIHYLLGTLLSLGYILVILYCFIKAAAGELWHIPALGKYAERLLRRSQ